jgi:hypothetical protein
MSSAAAASADATPSAVPRSLADDLRSRSDERLARLLRARPDLLRPVPADVRALATRAATAPSVLRCLDRYDAFALGVAELIAAEDGPTSVEQVVDQVLAATAGAGLPRDRVSGRAAAAVDDLVDVGLLWGPPTSLRMIRTAKDALQRGTGVADASPATTTADRLLAVDPPQPADAVRRDPTQVDRAAGQSALDTVRLAAALIDLWSAAPPPVLRAGGLGVRDLARVAEALDLDEEHAAFIVELAAGAGLIADDGAADPAFAPTEAADAWAEGDAAQRWAVLAASWAAVPRAAGLVGTRDAKGQRVAALSAEVERSSAATVRRSTWAVLDDLPRGSAPTAQDVVARLDWRHPRRASALRDDLVAWTLREAAWLGVTGLGALAASGRALDGATGAPDERLTTAAKALRALLPPPVDHVILQPDLTAVAPGPLEDDLARRMGALADIESTGGATVYRFSEASLRRGFDAGWDATTIVEFLTAVSRTPVPQPLTYLVGDIARRHGSLRIGAASAYVRCDDPDTLTALLASRLGTTLHLRRLAPTVAITPVAGPVVLERLQEAGHAPALESEDGVVVVSRPRPHRARPLTTSGAVRTGDGPADERLVEAAVRALRHGETVGRTSAPAPELREPIPGRGSPGRTLATLRDAITDRAAVRIGYAGSDGTTLEHLLDPVAVVGGQLTAYDHRAGDVRTFAVSRVTGVELLGQALTDPLDGTPSIPSEEPA